MLSKHSNILSSAEHEEFCVKLPGPYGKAKYSRETDREPVPWGKGEKHFEQKSEIVPETVRLQAVGDVYKRQVLPTPSSLWYACAVSIMR